MLLLLLLLLLCNVYYCYYHYIKFSLFCMCPNKFGCMSPFVCVCMSTFAYKERVSESEWQNSKTDAWAQICELWAHWKMQRMYNMYQLHALRYQAKNFRQKYDYSTENALRCTNARTERALPITQTQTYHQFDSLGVHIRVFRILATATSDNRISRVFDEREGFLPCWWRRTTATAVVCRVCGKPSLVRNSFEYFIPQNLLWIFSSLRIALDVSFLRQSCVLKCLQSSEFPSRAFMFPNILRMRLFVCQIFTWRHALSSMYLEHVVMEGITVCESTCLCVSRSCYAGSKSTNVLKSIFDVGARRHEPRIMPWFVYICPERAGKCVWHKYTWSCPHTRGHVRTHVVMHAYTWSCQRFGGQHLEN